MSAEAEPAPLKIDESTPPEFLYRVRYHRYARAFERYYSRYAFGGIGAILFVSNYFSFSKEFVAGNLLRLLWPIFVAILSLLIATVASLLPPALGLTEALARAREDTWVDAGIRKVESEPPRSWSQVARSTQRAMTIIAQQRRMTPVKRVFAFLGKLSVLTLLLATLIRVLVALPNGPHFGLGASSSFLDYVNASIVALVTFGSGIIGTADFSAESIGNRLLFQAGVSLVSIACLGLGINLLGGSVGETTSMTHLCHAIRMHFEVSADVPDKYPDLSVKL